MDILIYTLIGVLVLGFVWFTRTKTREFRFIQKNDEKWYVKRKFVYLWCIPVYHYEMYIDICGRSFCVEKLRTFNYETAEEHCKKILRKENWKPIVRDVTF